MKLKSFKIHSYRSCIKAKLDLNPQLTTLIGINGAGKSNILNSLLLLQKKTTRRFSNRKGESSPNVCKIQADILHEKKLVSIKAKIYFATDERNLDEIKYSDIKWNFNPYAKNSKWELVLC